MSPRKRAPEGPPGTAGEVVSTPAHVVLRDAAGRFVAGSGRPPRARRRRLGGGQPGNLNRAQYPWRSFWRRRALRQEDRWILPLLGDYTSALVADRGGPDEVTAAELRLIELAALARGCEMLILATAASRGGLTADLATINKRLSEEAGHTATMRRQDLLNALSRFIATEQRALLGLGLGRRPRDVPSLEELSLQLRAQSQDGGMVLEVDAGPPEGPGIPEPSGESEE